MTMTLYNSRRNKDMLEEKKKAKWEVLEKHSDGTTRCRCTKCKNTMNLSIHTFDCFNYCPNCGKAMK